MRGLIYSITVFLFVQAALGNPLGNCAGGRAVPYSFASGSGGACNIPTIGIPAANVDGKFFNGGAQCGACYEVTGPLGTVTVQIVDQCGVGTVSGECNGDVTQFGIDETSAFNLIVNRSEAKEITDLGYRSVTCEVSGNVQYEAAKEASNNYFSMKLWNFRVPITDVRVKGNGWSGYDQLTRQGTSGTFQWNKNKNNLNFPITIYLVGSTQELIQAVIPSFATGTADFGDQFTNVAAGNGAKCPMNSSPALVFADQPGSGWSYYAFGGSAVLDTTNVYLGSNSIHASVPQYGGLSFARTGEYNPLYFSYLTFAAKSASGDVNLKVYLRENGLESLQTVTADWKVFNISVSSLTTSSAEKALSFLNMNPNYVDLYFDEIRWEVAAISPLDNVSQVTTTGYQFADTTTTAGVVIVTGSSSTGSTGGSSGFSFSSEDDSSSSIVGVSMVVLVCLAALL